MKLGVKNKVLICLIQSMSRLMEKTELASGTHAGEAGHSFPFQGLGKLLCRKEAA